MVTALLPFTESKKHELHQLPQGFGPIASVRIREIHVLCFREKFKKKLAKFPSSNNPWAPHTHTISVDGLVAIPLQTAH
jgi:hypothetical protein